MRFSEVIGQSAIKGRLREMVQEGRVPHAFLFSEEAGRGALPLALAFASYLFCPNRDREDSCGVCPTCNRTAKLIHPDLHFSMPINSTRRLEDDRLVSDLYLEEWRESLLENPYLTEAEWYRAIKLENKSGFIGVGEAKSILRKFSLKAYEGGVKVMIIWLPEKMNLDAANRLLKLIEEPPVGNYLIMVSNFSEKIIPTILSRCQIVTIPPIESSALEKRLEEQFQLDQEGASFWAKVSEGSLSRAMELLSSDHQREELELLLQQLLEGSFKKDLLQVVKFAEELSKKGREEQRLFIFYTLDFIRSALMISREVPEIGYITPSKREQLLFWSAHFKEPFYRRSYQILNGALEEIGRNVNSRFIFTDLGNRFFLYL